MLFFEPTKQIHKPLFIPKRVLGSLCENPRSSPTRSRAIQEHSRSSAWSFLIKILGLGWSFLGILCDQPTGQALPKTKPPYYRSENPDMPKTLIPIPYDLIGPGSPEATCHGSLSQVDSDGLLGVSCLGSWAQLDSRSLKAHTNQASQSKSACRA